MRTRPRFFELDRLRQSTVVAVRALWRDRGFTTVAVLTLACGLGLGTAMFGFVDAIWLRGAPYRHPERLLALFGTNPARGLMEDGLSLADAVDLRQGSRTLADLALVWSDRVTIAGGGEPLRLEGARVTANLLPLLGVEPALGRGFVAADDRPGAPRVAILSDALWRRAFGGRADAVGSTVRIDGESSTVVGVLPAAVRVPAGDAADIIYPLARDAASMPRQGRPFKAVARLREGRTLEEAQSELRTLATRLELAYPQSNAGWSVAALPLASLRTRGFEPFRLLWGAVGLLWLIACANLASLVLQRSIGRQRETAVRLALGSGVAAVVRQVYAECLAITLLGSLLGLAFARLLIAAVLAVVPAGLRGGLAPTLDLRLAAYAGGLALLSAALVGSLAVIRLARLDLAGTLKESAAAVAGSRRGERLRRGVLVAELALSVVLLVGAMLCARSFRALARVDPGFDPASTVALDLPLAEAQYPDPAARAAFYEQAIARTRGLPGVVAVGTSSRLPLATGYSTAVRTAEQSESEAAANPAVGFSFIAGDALRALGMPVLRGRPLADRATADRPPAIPEVLVSARLAKTLWPGEDAVGRSLVVPLMRSPTPFTVVGVVGDVLRGGLEGEGGLDIYLPYRLRAMGAVELFVRTAGDPRAVMPAVRRELRALDPSLPLDGERPLSRLVDDALWLQRAASGLFALFAAAAVALTAVGLYGVLATSLLSRRRELAVRSALGARRSELIRGIAVGGLALAALGGGLGLLAAWFASRLLAHLLFGVRTNDALAYALAAGVLLLVALVASLIPAARATRADPTAVLREA